MSSPSPKSFRSRMGGVIRRTSSVLAVSRPTTPTPSSTPIPPKDDSRRSSISKSQEGRKSTSSLTQSSTAPAPTPAPAVEVEVPTVIAPAEEAPVPEPAPAPEATDANPPQANGATKAVKRLLPIAAQYQQYPSPIAESPAREAAASNEDVVAPTPTGPSPLGQASDIFPPEAEEQVSSPPVQEEATPAPEVPEEASSLPQPVPSETEAPVPSVPEFEEAYVPPPPMLDSSNPGAFTDEPEEMQRPPTPDAPAAEEAPPAEPVATSREHAYFDLVRPADPDTVHDVLLASPGTASETVVGDEQRFHISPYPYDMEPAQPHTDGVAPVEQPAPEIPVEGERGEETRVPRPMEWEDNGGWQSEVVFMPVSQPATRSSEDPFADPPGASQTDVRERENEERDTVPIVVIHPQSEQDRNRDAGTGGAGGVSTIAMPIPTEEVAIGPFGSIHTMPSADIPRSHHGHFRFTEPSTEYNYLSATLCPII
ncbi:hypothetical protein C8J57DRAFT_67878 [Mycena rebaudengoi]|nr:hypothetical protein C8J57DRAFT_67878 [Mycena rebaudengoi]